MLKYSFSILVLCVFAVGFLQGPPKRYSEDEGKKHYEVASFTEMFRLPAGSIAHHKSLAFKVYLKKEDAVTDGTERTLTPVSCKIFCKDSLALEWNLKPGVAPQNLFFLPVCARNAKPQIIVSFYVDAEGRCYQAIVTDSPSFHIFSPYMHESYPRAESYSLMHQPGSPEAVDFWRTYTSK